MRLTVLKNHVPINDVLVETPDLTERYEIYVGRSEDCHVLIDDPLISRHHFVLKNENGKWLCEKLTQLGVVSINGVVSDKMEVQDGDEIKCGVYSLMVSDLPRLFTTTTAQPVYQQPEPAFFIPEAKPVKVVEDLPSIDSMSDDLAPAEELDSTMMMSSPSAPEDDSLSMDEFSNNDDNSFQDDSSSSLSDSEETSSDSFGSSDDGGGFGDDSSSEMEDDSDEKTSFFKAFVNYQLVLFGEHAPYDRYQIDSAEIFIGRDPKKCQIILDDPEVSTVHAVIRKNNIEIILEDLNSSNGTILNGERINRATLSTGDEFVIGSTSFSLETRSDLLEAESDRLMPVEKNQSIDLEEIEEELVDVGVDGVDFNSGDGPPEKSIFKRFRKDPAFRKKALYVIVGLAILLMFLPNEDEKIKPAETAPKKESVDKNATPAKVLSKEMEEKRNMSYELGVSFFDQQKLYEALKEFQTVMEIDPDYKNVQSFFKLTQDGLKNLEELEAQKRAEEERLKTKKMIEELLVKARDAVKDRNITVAESLFAQIAEKDPENMEVQQLKLELEAWQKEQERIALEKAAKEAARKAMVDALNPGKTYYLKKEWYRAILKLEEFLRRKGTDEDLVKEGSDMLSDAKNQLASELGPLVGKARSLKEGQDLKSAYEAYLDILKVEPTHAEALNEVDDIRAQLESRSKKIYREAIIAESLSLFSDAKEKFTEVQQISPSDSEYYRKAAEKLKNYLE